MEKSLLGSCFVKRTHQGGSLCVQLHCQRCLPQLFCKRCFVPRQRIFMCQPRLSACCLIAHDQPTTCYGTEHHLSTFTDTLARLEKDLPVHRRQTFLDSGNTKGWCRHYGSALPNQVHPRHSDMTLCLCVKCRTYSKTSGVSRIYAAHF